MTLLIQAIIWVVAVCIILWGWRSAALVVPWLREGSRAGSAPSSTVRHGALVSLANRRTLLAFRCRGVLAQCCTDTVSPVVRLSRMRERTRTHFSPRQSRTSKSSKRSS